MHNLVVCIAEGGAILLFNQLFTFSQTICESKIFGLTFDIDIDRYVIM